MNTQFESIKIRSFILTFFLFFVMLSVIGGIVMVAGGREEPSVIEAVILEVSFYLIPALWLFITCKKANLTFTSFWERNGKVPIKDTLVPVIMLIILAMGVVYLQSYALSYIAPEYVLSNMNISLLFSEGTVGVIVFNFISAVLLGPIVEELIFRGFLIQRLSYKFGMTKAVIISSLAFGVLHFDIIGATIFGIVCAILYIKTKSLFVPIIVHIVNNFTAAMYEIIVVNTNGVAKTTLADIQSTSSILWGIGLTSVSLIWLIPFLKRNWHVVKDGQAPLLRTKNTPPNLHL
jgi:uncharacterized protein